MESYELLFVALLLFFNSGKSPKSLTAFKRIFYMGGYCEHFALPLAWYATNIWQQSFAYRVRIGFFSFFLAAIATFTIALVTVSFQAIKAARANPVDSLRYE